MNGTRALTVRYNGHSNTLVSDIGIATAFDPTTLAGKPAPALKAYKGIWDTGATASVITQKVVDDLGLQPIRLTKVHHAQGNTLAEVYLVCIALPNQVAFPSVSVTKGALPNADALIGMDIIGQGDFAVTNHSGTTVFSYRIPSVSTIDFLTNNAPTPQPKTPTVGRNDPCPCGSGKKYKKCCANKPPATP